MNIKKLLIDVLRRYKNIDIKLRENTLYELISFHVFNILRSLIGLKPIGHHRIIEHYYIKILDDTELKTKTILFDSFQGQKVAGDPYAVYRALRLRNEGYSIVWVKRTDTYIPTDVQQDKSVHFVNYNSKEHVKALTYCETLVFNMNLPPFFIKRDGQILINTWHGVPIKKLGLDIDQPLRLSANTQRCFNISDIMSMASQYEYDRTVGALGAELHECIITKGSPRVDLMLNADREAIRKQLGVSASKKVVLYAPTWRGGIGSVSAHISEQIEAISELQQGLGEDYEVIVSLHHFTQAALKGRNISVKQLPASIDTNEALQAVDILVSDYSSIALDFLLLDKPLVLFTPDYQQYSIERGLYFDINELPANIAFNSNDLVNCVRQELKPSEFDEYHSKLRFFFEGEDGYSAERIIDEIYRFRKTPKASNKKNILIFPGSLKDNGITSSIKALIENLEHSELRVFMLIDARFQRIIPQFYKNFCFFKDKVEFVLVDRYFPKHGNAALAYRKYLKDPGSLSTQETRLLDSVFAKETTRIFGNTKFYAAIDFSGYDQYWTYFISSIDSNKKIVFLHSDMKAEYENPGRKNGRLRNVFSRYNRFDVVASVSEALAVVNRESLSRYFDESKSFAIENTISIKRIKNNSEVPLGIVLPEMALLPTETIKFVCVGRLSPEKNFKLAIDSFDIVAKTYDCVLFIVGDGPLSKQLKSYSASKESASRIKFVGHLENPYPVIKSADCLLLTSYYEGQALVLLEALTLNTFCISSDIPAAKNVLERTGAFVARPEVGDFSKSMLDFIKSRPLALNFDADRYNDLALSKFMKAIQ